MTAPNPLMNAIITGAESIKFGPYNVAMDNEKSTAKLSKGGEVIISGLSVKYVEGNRAAVCIVAPHFDGDNDDDNEGPSFVIYTQESAGPVLNYGYLGLIKDFPTSNAEIVAAHLDARRLVIAAAVEGSCKDCRRLHAYVIELGADLVPICIEGEEEDFYNGITLNVHEHFPQFAEAFICDGGNVTVYGPNGMCAICHPLITVDNSAILPTDQVMNFLLVDNSVVLSTYMNAVAVRVRSCNGDEVTEEVQLMAYGIPKYTWTKCEQMCLSNGAIYHLYAGTLSVLMFDGDGALYVVGTIQGVNGIRKYGQYVHFDVEGGSTEIIALRALINAAIEQNKEAAAKLIAAKAAAKVLDGVADASESGKGQAPSDGDSACSYGAAESHEPHGLVHAL